jgi:hypothetical protein
VSSEVYIYRQRDSNFLRKYSFIGAVEAKNNDSGENKRNTMSIV